MKCGIEMFCKCYKPIRLPTKKQEQTENYTIFYSVICAKATLFLK